MLDANIYEQQVAEKLAALIKQTQPSISFDGYNLTVITSSRSLSVNIGSSLGRTLRENRAGIR